MKSFECHFVVLFYFFRRVIMDKNEIIILSSDEESDLTLKVEDSKNSIKTGLKNSQEFLSACLEKFKNITVNKNKQLIILKRKQGVVSVTKVPEKKQKIISNEYPEVVDLESSEKSVDDEQIPIPCRDNQINEKHSNPDVIDIDEIPNGINLPCKGENEPINNEIKKPDVTSNDVSKLNTVPENIQTDVRKKEGSDQNLKFFTDFVEYCGGLEEIPNDRVRLTKKLMKRYGEADLNYIKSQEFRNLIQKCRDRVSKNNLYLIAKEITDELTFRKKIEMNTGKSSLVKEASQRDEEVITVTEKVQECTKNSKKRTKVIKKIIKKLDKLGGKIKELEEEEVDLSDEEESTYVQLQRYRERFWQIYRKLCKYTNEVTDADRIYDRKICFNESKYPAINRCIENWLNKTKRFPDFTDIMKLLESQSDSLGLPSNRESIRVIAIEIFQQVGVMLQRRRQYDLWDSFCGFLGDGKDPATEDTLLDRVLKNNYDIRVKKEQEIFKRFAELQENQRLEPEEVPDDEANHSPVESGNEDDKEIEDIENSLNRRLDAAIRMETEENGTIVRNSELEEGKNNSLGLQKDGEKTPVKLKESKNNFKNCKSLKWRLENGLRGKKDSGNSEDSATGPETEKETLKKPENEVNGLTEVTPKCNVEVTTVKDTRSELMMAGCVDSPSKRKRDSESEDGQSKKRKCSDKENEEKEVDLFEVEDNSETTKTSEVLKDVQVHWCQIFTSNAFEDLDEEEEDWGKRKVFRDLTNVGRLMGQKKKTNNAVPMMFPISFPTRKVSKFEKRSCKRRLQVSFRAIGLKGKKCALNPDEKSGETVNPDSGGDQKTVENDPEGAGEHEDMDNSYSGRGNGSEGDNNEDENKRNGRTGDELNENQHEDEEEDEENENEKEENCTAEAESVEHSVCTEEPPSGNGTPNQEEKEEIANEESLPTDLGFEEEHTKEIDKQVEETQSDDLNKESAMEQDEQEKETVEEEEMPETREEETEPNECKTSELPETETRELVEGNNSETQNECTEREQNLGEDRITESEEETKEVEEDRITKSKEETNEVEQDGITKSEEETNKVEEEKESVTKNEEEVLRVEDSDSTTEDDAAMETEITRSEEITETETKNEEAVDTECKDEVTKEVMETECEDGAAKSEEAVETKDDTTKAAVEPERTSNEVEMSNDINSKLESQSSSQDTEKRTPAKRLLGENVTRKSSERLRNRPTPFIPNENERLRTRKRATGTTDNNPTIMRRSLPAEAPGPKLGRRNAPSDEDEERVKRFLLHSPSSISITPPRKLAVSKPPSQAAMQALATLRNLKGISATIVRGGKPKSEDDVVVIGGSYRRRVEQNACRKRRQTNLPVISNVQSGDSTTPKIVTVQGNVSGFDSSWADDSQYNSSSIRISNVWGSLPNSFMQQSGQNSETVTPGCSSRQNNPGSSTAVKKKNAKKTVEYVVLE